MLVTSLVTNQTKPKPPNRPNKIGSCSSWATSLTFFLSEPFFYPFSKCLVTLADFKALDMEMKVCCPQGVHDGWEGQISAPIQC